MTRTRKNPIPEIGPELAHQLKELRVRIDTPDPHTIILRHVPTNARFFNKPQTNLLLKRSDERTPFLVLVDDDLEYLGKDRLLARTLAAAPKQAGWLAVFSVEASADPSAAMQQALDLIGFQDSDPALPFGLPPAPPASGKLLTSLGIDLTERVREGSGEPTVGREDSIIRVAAAATHWGQARMALVVGDSGVGKTNLLYGVAAKLGESRPDLRSVSVDLSLLLSGAMFPSERENALLALINEAASEPGLVLCLERADMLQSETGALALLLANGLDSGLPIIGTALPQAVGQLVRPPLARRVQVVRLESPSTDEMLPILATVAGKIASHHMVEIDDSCLKVCAARASKWHVPLPASAISLLDAAAAMASLSGSGVVGPDDILRAAGTGNS